MRHHVNLQCVKESGGSVIVLFAALWLFYNMLPHHVLRHSLVTFVCLFAIICHLVFLQLMCLCVSAITLVKLVGLLAILLHHVSLQCVGERGGCMAFLRHAS